MRGKRYARSLISLAVCRRTGSAPSLVVVAASTGEDAFEIGGGATKDFPMEFHG